jgi:hypothetical protein
MSMPFALCVFFVSDERQAQATVVGGVFAEGEPAVDLDVIYRGEATVPKLPPWRSRSRALILESDKDQ